MRRPLRAIPALALLLALAGCASNGPQGLVWLEGGRPSYPGAARAQGVEGHVEVEYTVTAEGTVRSPRVVESVPRGVFDGAALRALMTWRYQPPAGGEAITGVRSRFEFQLGEAYGGL